MDQRNYSCVGNSAAMLLRSLNIDVVIISTRSGARPLHAARGEGAGQAGCWRSPAAGCVSDSSKYGKYGMFRVCLAGAAGDIICDAALPPEAQQCWRERGLQLHNVQL